MFVVTVREIGTADIEIFGPYQTRNKAYHIAALLGDPGARIYRGEDEYQIHVNQCLKLDEVR